MAEQLIKWSFVDAYNQIPVEVVAVIEYFSENNQYNVVVLLL